ncbi:MAG: zinc-dependent alcohol dehydrogenase [Candidatus Hadarchaeota archaeon]
MKNEKVVFEGCKEVVLREEDIPDPSDNQILVENSRTLISTGTELTILSGKYPEGSEWSNYGTFPFYPGYSGVGRVIDVGEGVGDFEIGDRVATNSPHQKYHLVDLNQQGETLIDAVAVPNEVTDSEASLHALATISMNGVRCSKVSLGECVVVVGEGIVGQFATMFSRLEGGFPVVAVEVSGKRIEMASKSGATHSVKSDQESVVDRLKEFNEGRWADVVFEVTGKPELIPWAIRLVKEQGRFIVLSSPRGETQIDFHDEVNLPSRIIKGAHVRSHPACETPYNQWTNERNTELFFRLLEQGEISVDHLLTHEFSYTEADKAYEMLLSDRTRAMGVILDFSSD